MKAVEKIKYEKWEISGAVWIKDKIKVWMMVGHGPRKGLEGFTIFFTLLDSFYHLNISFSVQKFGKKHASFYSIFVFI